MSEDVYQSASARAHSTSMFSLMQTHHKDAFLSAMIISGRDAYRGLTSLIFISTFHISYKERVLKREGRGPLTSLTTSLETFYKSQQRLDAELVSILEPKSSSGSSSFGFITL